MKSIFSKVMSLALSLLMVFYVFPYSVIGAQAEAGEAEIRENEDITSTEGAEADKSEPVYVLYEADEMRKEKEKHYRLSNGSFAAVEFPYDVHYKNNEGELEEIDNTLTLTEKGYNNTAGEVRYTFTADSDSGDILSLDYRDYGISLGFADEAPAIEDTLTLQSGNDANNTSAEKSIEIINPGVSVQEEASTHSVRGSGTKKENKSLEDMFAEVKNEASIKYVNISEGIDLRYDLLGNSIKEYIILKKAPESNIFSFEMSFDGGLVPVLNEDRSISLINRNEEQIFSIPAPYMADNKGEISEDCEYILTPKKDGYSLSVSVSSEWLNDGEREYPVMIDPAVIVDDEDNSITTGYYRGATGSTVYSTGTIYMGRDNSSDGTYTTYMKINTLPELPYATIPIKAVVMLGQSAFDDGGGSMEKLTVSARLATGSSWQTSYDSNRLDHTVLSGDSAGSFVSWDVSKAAKGWYKHLRDSSAADAVANNGIVFVPEDSFSGGKAAKASFCGFHSSNFSYNNEPKFVVYYRNIIGVENYYSYHTQDIGGAGVGYVRAYDGDLTLIRADASYSSVAMPFTVSHVYNTKYAKTQFTSAGTVLNTKKYDQMYAGKGWKLNVQQSLVRKNFEDLGDSTDPYLVYTDGDGTEHYFYYSSEDGKYYDEDGLNLSVIINNDNEWDMKDDNGNWWYFYNGYLYKMQDANSNFIYIHYSDTSGNEGMPSESRNRIVRVTQRTSGTTAEKTVAAFGYGSNKFLSTITDYAGRVTTFTYNGDSQLAAVNTPGNNNMRYLYDSTSKLLSRVYDSEIEYGIDYTYNASGSINYFSEFTCPLESFSAGYTGEQGARYWYNTTEDAVSYVRYCGNDRTAYTADDSVTTYLFDDFARTVNSYTANRKLEDGYSSTFLMYGTSATAYTEPERERPQRNNRITANTATGGIAGNRLMNPGAEDSGNWGAFTQNTNALYVRSGLKSFKLTGSSTGDVFIKQTRKLFTTGKYTASVYVKVLTESENADIALNVYDSTGACESSRRISRATADNGWDRLSVTFDAAANKYYDIELRVKNSAATVYADDFQLEAGEGASRPNILPNGDFEYSNDSGWTTVSGSGSQGSYSGNTMPGGTSSFKLTSGYNTDAEFAKTVTVNAQSKAETYIFSGWAKADSVPFRTNEEDATKLDSTFGLYAEIIYADSELESDICEASFNPDIRGEWQYATVMIIPKKNSPIKKIRVGGRYGYNNGSAYFDDLCLIREEVQTYEYNDDGYPIKVGSSASEDAATYSFSGSNIMEAVMPGSGTYNYTYNTTGNTHLVSTVSCEDLVMSLQYNSSGSNTCSTLTSNEEGAEASMRSVANYTADRDHISSTIDLNGISSSYSYNSKGELASSSVQSSETAGTGDITTSYVYDSMGRNTMVYQSGTVSLVYTYTDGQISGITRGGYIGDSNVKQEQTYSFVYDEWGNTAATKAGDTELAEYSYAEGNGNLTRMTYGNGSYIDYRYDNLDRIVKVLYNGIDKYEYSYNTDGSLYRVMEYRGTGDGAVVLSYYYNYDGIGRLIDMQIYGDGVYQSGQIYEYDNIGRVQRHTDKGGDNQSAVFYSYNDDGSVSVATNSYKAGNKSATNRFVYSYDELRRVESVRVEQDSTYYNESYLYADNLKNNGYSSNLVSGKCYSIDTLNEVFYRFSYEYDRVGNIKSSGTSSFSSNANDGETLYIYDKQNQLVMESSEAANETYVYVYDTYGNIREKKTYADNGFMSLDSIITNGVLLSTETYTYGDSEWKDRLSAYNGVSISYDAIGNPLSYSNGSSYSFTWENGRQLASADCDGIEMTYEYNHDGLRTKKTVEGGETYLYYYSGDKLISMTWDGGERSLNFLYNGSTPYSMVYYDGSYTTSYYYITNIQGDVVAIMNASHAIVAEYVYDAWGNIISVTDGSGNELYFNTSHIAHLNPIRYRGYYYDIETGFYYLQSRYYDPVVGRFINGDAYASTGTGFLGHNMYTYCLNNPVRFTDDCGNCPYDGTSADFRRLERGEPPLKCKCNNKDDNALIDGRIDKDTPPDHKDYKPPKKYRGGKVKNPNGKGKGWPAADGGVWIPNDHMHGGEGWTVQYPGGDHSHAYPGGGVRNHFEVEQSYTESMVNVVGGTLCTAVLLLDNLFLIGVADDPLIAVSCSMVITGIDGFSGKEICSECGEIRYGY